MDPRQVQLRESIQRSATVGGVDSPMQILESKWAKEIGILHEAFKGKISDEKKIGTAIMLENTERFLRGAAKAKSMFALTEATQPLVLAA